MGGWKEATYHLWGWALFLLCAIFFAASGIRNGDVLTVAGSTVFLVACVFFIIPLIKRDRRRRR